MNQLVLLGDCTGIMPMLGRFGAVDNRYAVVYAEKHEQTAKRQRRSPEESGSNLGAAQGADHGSIRQRRFVSSRDGGGFLCVSARVPARDCTDGDTVEGPGTGWGDERQVHRRDAIDGVSFDDRQREVQPLRGDGSTRDPSHGPRPHQQHTGELRGSLQSVPQQPPQDRMVALSEGWAVS